MSINRVVISGNLTREPELRSTSSGTAVLTFGVAVNDRRRNAQGEWEDYANFFDCTMFGTRAQGLSNYLAKGQKVAIEGKLRWSSWENSEGQKRSKVEIIVDNLEFMSSRNGGDGQGYNHSSGGYGQNSGNGYGQGGNYGQNSGGYGAGGSQSSAPQIDTTASIYDEEIPF